VTAVSIRNSEASIPRVECGLFAAAFLLRLGLGVQTELWFDEIHSIALAEFPVADLLNPRILQGFGPLYFLFLKAWMTLGHGDVWLRAPSMIADAAAAALLYRLLASQFEGRIAALAAALYILSPWNIFCGSQVRMHAFGAPLLLAWLIARGSARRCLIAVILALVLPSAAPFLAMLWFGAHTRRDQAGLIVAFLICLGFASSGLSSGVHYESAQFRAIPGTVKGIFFGPYIESPPSIVSMAITATAMMLVLVGAWQAGKKGLIITILAYVPLHLFLIASLFLASYWNRRFVIPGSPFILALAALGLEALPLRSRRAAAAACLAVVGFFTLRLLDISDPFLWRSDRRPQTAVLVRELAEQRQEILLDLPAAAPVVMWYGPHLEAWGDSRAVAFSLPPHRFAIMAFLQRRGVRFETPPDSGVIPISEVFAARARAIARAAP
jgi:hypothetical protein